MSALDPRLAAYREDIADERLRGKVDAARFVAGKPARVSVPVADLRQAPGAGVDSQMVLGDDVRIFERREGWCWVQADFDGYVGYAPAGCLEQPGAPPTHVVAVPRSFVYPDPELKRAASRCLSLGSRVRVAGFAETRGNRYAVLETGEALMAGHVRPLDQRDADYVSVAETLEWTPYLWGGASAFGIDCSGLIQLAMRMTGRVVLRDTDMQSGSIGVPLDVGPDLAGLRRGDLVFWKGHVAILTSPDEILHANGRTMIVSREPLRAAVERIGRQFGAPTGFRRP